MRREVASVRLETPRLILRTVTMADLDAVAAGWDLDGGHLSPDQARERVAWMLENHARLAAGALRHLCLAIVDKESGAIIGWCGLDHRDAARPHPVLFYLLQARHRGKGLATEAAGAVLDYAFRELCLARVDAAAACDNLASKRVMEKIGMRSLGPGEDGSHAFTLGRQEHDLFAGRSSDRAARDQGGCEDDGPGIRDD